MSTILHFDYGGHYVKKGDGYEWVSTGCDGMFPLLFKGLSPEEVSYSMLLDGVCRKLGIDSGTTELKLSFIPLDIRPMRHSYIRDDDDVYVYLTSKDTNHLRSVMHVEKVSRKNELQKGKGVVSRKYQLDKGVGSQRDQASSVGVNYEETGPIGTTDVRTDYGVEEQHHEPMEEEENDGSQDCENDGTQDCENEGSGDSHYSSDGNRYNGMELEIYEPICDEENELEKGWEDGMDVAVGTEFANKKEVKAFVERGKHKASFATKTSKSDTTRYVLRCSLSGQGCEWYFNAVKVINSFCYRVSVYNNIHTCSQASTSGK